jgi:hypothetical protein
MMRFRTLIVLLPLLWLRAEAAMAYAQPPRLEGRMLQSSWWAPDGSDYDQTVWDSFTLKSDQTITEIGWRGGFDPAKAGSGGPVIDFKVRIYPSAAGDMQPNVSGPPLVAFSAGGNAGQVLGGRYGGVPMYDYRVSLPAPFQAIAGKKYWIEITAAQKGIPDWGIAIGMGGDGKHFVRLAGTHAYRIADEDAAFILLTSKPVEPAASSH